MFLLGVWGRRGKDAEPSALGCSLSELRDLSLTLCWSKKGSHAILAYFVT